MAHCELCGKNKWVGGFQEEGRFFCSRKCAAGFQRAQRGFCEKCQTETTDVSLGNVRSFNGIGTGLGFRFPRSRCPACDSVIRRKWFYFFFPLVPLGKFRVIDVVNKGGFGGQTRIFLSRRLKDA